jgi:WD40 repeat protein
MIRLWNIIDNPQVNNFTLMHKKIVFGLSFTSDGGYLASSSADFTVVIWHLPSRKPVKYWHVGRVFPRNLSFLYDKSLVVGMEDGSVKMFSLQSSSQKARNFKAHIGQVTNVSFPGNSSFVMTQSSDFKAKIWDFYKKSYLGSLKNHNLPIVKSYICPLNQNIITQDTSFNIRIFILPDKTPKHLISPTEILNYISKFPGLNNFL